MSNAIIYRGYNIDNNGIGLHPWRVSKDNILVCVTKTEDEALAFVDQSKRDLRNAAISQAKD